MTKTPTPTEQSKKQRDNIKTPPKTFITQLLRTDLGRSVGVTAVTQLVWLNRFTSAKTKTDIFCFCLGSFLIIFFQMWKKSVLNHATQRITLQVVQVWGTNYNSYIHLFVRDTKLCVQNTNSYVRDTKSYIRLWPWSVQTKLLCQKQILMSFRIIFSKMLIILLKIKVP